MTTTVSTTALKTTWQEVFSTGDDVVGLNTIHNQVVQLLSTESKEDLSDSEQKYMMGNITALKLNSIMFLSTFGEMTILHHNTKLGGDLLCPQAEHFGLFGYDRVGIPFKLKPESLLKINEIDAPSWTTIQAIKTPENLAAARDATPNLRYFTSAIAIPPFLTTALMALLGPSATDVFMEVLRASTKLDAQKESSAPASTEINKDISAYL